MNVERQKLVHNSTGDEAVYLHRICNLAGVSDIYGHFGLFGSAVRREAAGNFNLHKLPFQHQRMAH